MLLALLGGVVAAAALAATFGVPLVAGAPVLLDVGAFGALAGAIVATLVARLRRKALPWRTLAVSTVLALLGAAHLRFAPAAPAVIVMVVDCLRADRLDPATMPKVTARLRDGVRFTRARAQSSWTRSAMPSLLTGRFPAEHGVYRTHPPDRIPDHVTLVSERFAAAGWLTAAFVQQPQLDPAFGYDRGWGRYGFLDGRAPALNTRFSRWNTLFRTVPRFVLVHWLDVHGPYTPGKGFRPRDLPPTTLVTKPYDEFRETLDAIERGAIVPTADDWAHLEGLYDGEVREIDARIGRLLGRLAADGTLDAAWLLFTADHGERFGEHGRGAHMGPPDEVVIAVPFVLRPPGGTQGRTVDDVVQHVDVVPTLLAAAGLEADPTLPGRDLGPALTGGSLVAAPSFAEEWARGVHHASVRDGDWKLVRGDGARLYDLGRDPGERHDVADEHPEVVARLEGLLAAYFEVGAAGAGAGATADWAAVDWAAAATSGRVWSPAAAPTSEAATPSAATMQALEALGYVEE